MSCQFKELVLWHRCVCWTRRVHPSVSHRALLWIISRSRSIHCRRLIRCWEHLYLLSQDLFISLLCSKSDSGQPFRCRYRNGLAGHPDPDYATGKLSHSVELTSKNISTDDGACEFSRGRSGPLPSYIGIRRSSGRAAHWSGKLIRYKFNDWWYETIKTYGILSYPMRSVENPRCPSIGSGRTSWCVYDGLEEKEYFANHPFNLKGLLCASSFALASAITAVILIKTFPGDIKRAEERDNVKHHKEADEDTSLISDSKLRSESIFESIARSRATTAASYFWLLSVRRW